jgi:pyruvyltransferase
MKVRTYYWHDRVISKSKFRLKELLNINTAGYFKVGNAGDVFAGDIIRFQYGCEAVNIKNEGKRLLCIGSISHKIQAGDIICGIGTKGLPVPKPLDALCKIHGLRGPITYEAFKKAGHDVSQVRFLKDPGLMIRFLAGDRQKTPVSGKVIFIPHYRERYLYKKKPPRGIEVVDVDVQPVQLANKIQEAGLVYASSLHGIIFAHALNRPCVFVKPQTDEPMIKYEDYYTSVDITYRKPIESIYDIDYKTSPDSPADLKYDKKDFMFPSVDSLMEMGIIQQ